MSDLVEFLRARRGEDEEMARAAAETGSPKWRYTVIPGDPDGYSLDLTNERILIVDWADKDELLPSEAEHAACHDPSRVLREVEADRQLIRQYEEAVKYYSAHPEAPAGEVTGLEYALRCRASVHAGHPDYDERWRP